MAAKTSQHRLDICSPRSSVRTRMLSWSFLGTSSTSICSLLAIPPHVSPWASAARHWEQRSEAKR